VTFLDRIVDAKRREVADNRESESFGSLLARVDRADVRNFHAAVSRPRAVIAELKARTPTIEAFAHSGNLLDLATTYARNGAAAISIVTDPARFGTSLDDVARVRDLVALPVIAKDFVIDPYQVVQARATGADAVLLIVRLLDYTDLRALLAVAHELGMSALVETHDESEVLAALAAGARIVGINNRDLDTMTVSLDTTTRLAHLVPNDVVLVAESGIQTRADIDRLATAGARAFLVGASLLAADDPGAHLRDLTGRTEEELSA
jgi:indole-3-glycerol phosphate synthase